MEPFWKIAIVAEILGPITPPKLQYNLCFCDLFCGFLRNPGKIGVPHIVVPFLSWGKGCQ